MKKQSNIPTLLVILGTIIVIIICFRTSHYLMYHKIDKKPDIVQEAVENQSKVIEKMQEEQKKVDIRGVVLDENKCRAYIVTYDNKVYIVNGQLSWATYRPAKETEEESADLIVKLIKEYRKKETTKTK